MLSSQFWEIFKKTFVNVCVGLLLKSKISSAIFSQVKLQIFSFSYYEQNRQLSYYEGTAWYISLKILERLNRVIFQNYSDWSLLKKPQVTKTYWKSTTKKTPELLEIILFGCFYNMPGTYFSSLYLVEFFDFSINGSEWVRNRLIF